MRSLFPKCLCSAFLICASLQAFANPTPAQIAAIRQRMDQSLAIGQLARDGIGHALHERVMALAPKMKGAPHLIISGNAKHGIAVSLTDGKLLVLSGHGVRPLTAPDLRTHEIFDHQQLHSLVEAVLDKETGTLPAAERPVPAPRQMAAWQVRSEIWRHPDAELIAQYHALVLRPSRRATEPLAVVAKSAQSSIALEPRKYEHGHLTVVHLDANGLPHANQFGVGEPEIPGLMKEMGIGDEAQIAAAMERALIGAARRGGIATASVAAARKAMEQQVAEAKQLVKWLNADHKERTLTPALMQLVVDARVEQKGPLPMSYESRVTLGESDEARIELVGQIYITGGAFNHYEVLAVPHAKGAAARQATLADLHASRLGSWSQIESAAKAAAARSPKARGFAERVALREALQAGLPGNPDLELLRAYQAFGHFPRLNIDGPDGDDLVLGEKGEFSVHVRNPGTPWSFVNAPKELELERRGILTLADLETVVRKALIAHAGLQGKPSDGKVVAAARRAIQARMETARRYLALAQQPEDPMLLAQHAASDGEHERGWNGFNDVLFYRPAFLAQTADKYLVWDDGALRTIAASSITSKQISLRHITDKKGWVTNGVGTSLADAHGAVDLPTATYSDLLDFKLPDQASFDAAMLANMARAGHLGDPSRLTLTEARRALAQQVKDVPLLVEAIEGKNADAIRLLGVYQQTHAPAAGMRSAAITLVTHPEGNLVLGDEGFSAQPVLRINGKTPTIGQLRRIGVGTAAALEALLHQKMFALARDSYH